MARILILGKNGQLANALQRTKPKAFLETIFTDHEDAPFENFSLVEKLLKKTTPQVVINASAYTKVDLAETEKELCYTINAKTPAQIAQWCAQNNSLFLHFSTDYVFDGHAKKPWQETDQPHPINVYGSSKLLGEQEILKHHPKALIFRTSWVYSDHGQNFVKTMLKLFSEKEELKVVNDQRGTPNNAHDLAFATWAILQQLQNEQKYAGLYHMSSQGECSWFEFAQAIYKLAQKMSFPLRVNQIWSIPTAEYKTAAQRPLNSCLNSEKLKRDFGIQLPFWEDSLKKCMEQLREG